MRGSQQSANAFGDAADALNKAAASLARDREKANTSSSATGFAEMLQQLQEMAKKQGSINAQAQGLMPGQGNPMSSEMQGTARALARQQRQIAEQLDELGDGAGGDRAAQLARRPSSLPRRWRVVASTAPRSPVNSSCSGGCSTLAGRSKRKSVKTRASAKRSQRRPGNELKPDNTNASGRSANRFREPTWDELRGLTADERRAILEYFKRINAKP
jgi:hypothetical protein